ncbi:MULTISPECIES: rhomboid family intramembrane serine protease [Priestia]|uniref:rhomboid family intramembrane serine protease n=1 Tax=Priestia TaxID=2800373 RepID=UPI0024BFCA73|nr:rhomboid family intramembrane serine protease [Priestia flexa]WHX79297.1 rhomboid family intramembrane serine protease [Priestia flexa]
MVAIFVRTESFREFRTYYPITFLLLCIHILLWALFLIPAQPIQSLFYNFVGYNGAIGQGEYWRLATSMFLHNSFAHLLFNSFSLFLFAPRLERELSRYKFLGFYIACGLLANVLTFIIQPAYYSHVGASGAIFGVFGAYIYFIRNKTIYFTKSDQQIVIVLLIIGLLSGFLNSGVNNVAHIGGFISGYLLTILFARK